MTDGHHRLIERTISICPQCLRRIDAQVVERGGSIYLLKHCPDHGRQEALLEKNAAYYLARGAYDKPGTRSSVQTARRDGCPFDCGLCPDHGQHTCIGLIEITGDCDLRCPDCYAGPGPGAPLDLETIDRMMDFFQASENGHAEVLQISGGEPCLHPRVLEVIERARSKRFKCVLLNTNGLRIAADPDFVRALAEFRGGFEVYLQFDGFEGRGAERLRGRDVSREKTAAVEALAAAEIPVTLVATIERGVNDHEIGAIIRYGMETPCVRGVNFQPLAFYGEPDGRDAIDRATLTEILEKAEEQTGGAVRISDFIPLPCNVERVAITYFYRSGDRFLPLLRRLDVKPHLAMIPNTFAFDADDFLVQARTAIERGPGGLCDCVRAFMAGLRPLIPPGYETATEDEKIRHINRNTFRISVSSFVDAYNFDLRSMRKECVHVITPDLRRVPFSAYNLVHRNHVPAS